MMMRVVEKQPSSAMTSAMLGAFRDRKSTRDEFLALVNHCSSESSEGEAEGSNENFLPLILVGRNRTEWEAISHRNF